MGKRSTITCGAMAAAIVLLAMTPARGAKVFEVALENPSFAAGADAHGVP